VNLAERVLVLDAALTEIPHAFGGALALAYYAEPRATIDIDLNLFVPSTDFDDVAMILLELGAKADETAARGARRDGQTRIMWDSTPLDLFFAYDAFHRAAASAVRRVTFADGEIPILAPEHLVVCKVVFDRPKDWVDIDAITADDTLIDVAEVLRWVGRVLGDDDPRYDRIAAVISR
jgi:hypothetical protein